VVESRPVCAPLGVAMRRFPAPSKIAGGFKVIDANGQALAYVYARDTKGDADIAKVLTMDEAGRVASNIAKLPGLLIAKRN
jgi:hypothetical protein